MKTPTHLNAMRAFEVSARHQSFSAAAAELHVTPAAVGQLVRMLEDWLETPLFHRAAGGRARLVPTEAAKRALPEIRAGFAQLAMGLERIREQRSSDILTVTISPAFAANWLLPRLDRFQTVCPTIPVRLDTNPNAVDFVSQSIDIGVRYGQGIWPGLTAEKLLDEEVYPVCSPDMLRKAGDLEKPIDLQKQTLIHDLSMDGHTGFPTWAAWLQKAGVADVGGARGMEINNSAAVLQAALGGYGIALARSIMARDDLASGRLVRLFGEISFSSPLAYYVVYRAESAGLPKIRSFRDWLMREAESVEQSGTKFHVG